MRANPLPLPLTVEQVDRDWLSRALGQPLAEAEIVDVIYGASTKIRVRIVSESPDLPTTLMIKGGFEEHSPRMATMYATEARFYRELAPVLPINRPRTWFAESDPESHQSIIIMEDLTAAGVAFLNVTVPQTFGDVAKRLKALARFHAASWNDPGFAPGGRWETVISRFDNPFVRSYFEHYLSPPVWRTYMETRGASLSRYLCDPDWISRALARIGELERDGPVCIIHGDTHLGNIYVEKDGTPGFLDAQIAKASPFVEVAYHLIGSLDMMDRARWEKPLLALYLDALADGGVQAPTFDAAWLAYRQSIIVGFLIFMVNETNFQTEWINTANVVRFGAAAVDHDLPALLP